MCSVVSVKLQQTSCNEINLRSVNIPTAVLHSVRTTSLTTSALILLARINCAAIATVSFILTVTTREVFLRRTSPTCITTSFKWRVPCCLTSNLAQRRPISERALESLDVARAPVDPHGLVALAWAVVRHTGSAPRRGRDLSPHDPDSALVRSRRNCNRNSK